ncbi:MAG: GIY-YIG nuclease family protein [Chloroflexi bacterium]|nr:MAG: GIY-YIG nuclease family protein [Chloroflexota bacterium]
MEGLDEWEGWNIEKPGTYVLVLHLARPARIVIGALGVVNLDAGYYLYVGSALNGLAGRLRRHLRTDGKRLHWHIDYLRTEAALVDVWWAVSPERLECEWAAALRRLPGVCEPVAGFGSSDCRCRSHLFYLADLPSPDDLAGLPFAVRASSKSARSETGPSDSSDRF